MQQHRIFNVPVYPILLVMFELCAYLSNDVYLPALPRIEDDFNSTTSLAQLTLTAWFFGSASLYLLLGPLSDRYGRRWVILGGVFLFVLTTFGCMLAPTIELLIIARFFQGMSICSIGSAGYATIHELYDQKTAIQFIAIMGGVSLMAPALGPLVGAYVLDVMTWQGIFGVLAFWGMLAGLLLWGYMPESLPPAQRHPLLWRTITQHYGRIVKNILFIRYTYLFCFSLMAPIAWLTISPFLVMETWGYSAKIFGLVQLLIFGALVVGTYTVKPLMARLGILPLIKLAIRIMLFSAILGLITVFWFSDTLLAIVIPLMIFVFSTSLIFSPSQRLAIEAVSAPMGLRMAIYSSLVSLFGFVGSLLGSVTYNGTMLWMAIVLAIAAVLVAVVNPKHSTEVVSSTSVP